jgi:hypothetical protein
MSVGSAAKTVVAQGVSPAAAAVTTPIGVAPTRLKTIAALTTTFKALKHPYSFMCDLCVK